MNFYGKKFVVFCFVPLMNGLITSSITFELLPKATNAVAHYFSANCVYFLSNFTSNGAFINQRTAKIVSLQTNKYFSFSNFSSYYNFLKRNENGQCTVPLRVIFHLKETELARDFKDFHAIYENYSVQANAGLWLIFIKSLDEKFIKKIFHNFYLPLDLEILCAWTNEEKVHLKEIFQVSASSSIRQYYFGVWALETGLVSSQPPSRYFRRSNFEGLRFNVGYVKDNAPFTITRSTAKEHSLDGYFGKIWHALEELLNISTTYVPVKLTRGSNENKNSWLKIMKMINEKKIDVGLGDFVLSSDRTVFLDFSYPLLVSNFQLYYQVTSEFSSQIYLLPFQTYVWLVLLNWWILSSAFLFVATLLNRRYSKKKEKAISMPALLFLTFGGLCAQSSPQVPRSSSCRMLFLFSYILATVMIPSYSAYLTRYLTSEPRAVSFDNVFDFYKSGTHEIILVDGSFEYYFFKLKMELSYLRKIFEEIKNKKLPKSYDEAINIVCTKRNVAFFTITSTFNLKWFQTDHSNVRSGCVLRKMTQDAGTLMNSLIFPKNSRFRKIIDHHLKSLQRAGVIKKFKEEFWIQHPKIRKKNWKTVSLKESFGVFNIIMFGIILSFTIFILESFVKKLFSTKMQRKIKSVERNIGRGQKIHKPSLNFILYQ